MSHQHNLFILPISRMLNNIWSDQKMVALIFHFGLNAFLWNIPNFSFGLSPKPRLYFHSSTNDQITWDLAALCLYCEFTTDDIASKKLSFALTIFLIMIDSKEMIHIYEFILNNKTSLIIHLVDWVFLFYFTRKALWENFSGIGLEMRDKIFYSQLASKSSGTESKIILFETNYSFEQTPTHLRVHSWYILCIASEILVYLRLRCPSEVSGFWGLHPPRMTEKTIWNSNSWNQTDLSIVMWIFLGSTHHNCVSCGKNFDKKAFVTHLIPILCIAAAVSTQNTFQLLVILDHVITETEPNYRDTSQLLD